MSFDPGGLRSASPALSELGRASPISRLPREEGMYVSQESQTSRGHTLTFHDDRRQSEG